MDFEEIDFPKEVREVLENLAGNSGKLNQLAYRPWTPRIRIFAFARACLQRGLNTEGNALMDIAANLPDPKTGEPPTPSLREMLQREMGDGVWWETEKMFGKPEVPRAEIWKAYDDFTVHFPASGKAPEAEERISLLRQMAAEDAEHITVPLNTMSPAAQAAEAIYQLRNIRNVRWILDPHYPSETPKQNGRDVITPINRLVELGDAAVPALIEALDDQRFTRSMVPSYNGTESPQVMRVSNVAQHILEFMSGRNFFARKTDNGKLINGTTRQQAEAWWAEKQGKGEEQVLVAQASAGGAGSEQAVRILNAKNPDATLGAIDAAIRATENESGRAGWCRSFPACRAIYRRHFCAGSSRRVMGS